jgi:hypothetical protein
MDTVSVVLGGVGLTLTFYRSFLSANVSEWLILLIFKEM